MAATVLSRPAFVAGTTSVRKGVESTPRVRLCASGNSAAHISTHVSTNEERTTSGSLSSGATTSSTQHFLDHQQSPRLLPNRAVVSVCKNKHCCRRGANALYMRLKDEAMVRRDIAIDVRTSTCLKHCKRGPAAHVSVFLEGEETAREVICVNVGSHDVTELAVAYTMLE